MAARRGARILGGDPRARQQPRSEAALQVKASCSGNVVWTAGQPRRFWKWQALRALAAPIH